MYSIFMAIMPIVAVWCFYAGYKLGKTDRMPEVKIESPKERKEKREVSKEQKEQIAGKILTAQKSRALMQEQSAREDAANKFRQIREEVSAADHLTVELCEKLVDRVFVYPNKRIEVEFK